MSASGTIIVILELDEDEQFDTDTYNGRRARISRMTISARGDGEIRCTDAIARYYKKDGTVGQSDASVSAWRLPIPPSVQSRAIRAFRGWLADFQLPEVA